MNSKRLYETAVIGSNLALVCAILYGITKVINLILQPEMALVNIELLVYALIFAVIGFIVRNEAKKELSKMRKE